jgi:hypothetical protein
MNAPIHRRGGKEIPRLLVFHNKRRQFIGNQRTLWRRAEKTGVIGRLLERNRSEIN